MALPPLDLGREIVETLVGQPQESPLLLDAKQLGFNLAVLAGSGSGKSCFLARLVEELILQTACRCIVLDPNSDFYLFRKAPEHSFNDEWSTRTISIRSTATGSELEAIAIPWPSVSMAFLADDVPGHLMPQLRHLHLALCDLCELHSLTTLTTLRAGDTVDEVSVMATLNRLLELRPKSDLLEFLAANSPTARDLGRIATALGRVDGDAVRSYLNGYIMRCIRNVAAVAHVGNDVIELYARKLCSLIDVGLVNDRIVTRLISPKREESYCEAIDLGSVQDSPTQRLVAAARVAAEWQRAIALREDALGRAMASKEDDKKEKGEQGSAFHENENRTPTFIIVDEAHNLMPSAGHDGMAWEELRDLFRRIVAEGRKYALFLIIVTQRPEKIDQFVLSECQNLLLMRCDPDEINSLPSLQRRVAGIQIDCCEDFGQGQGLMIGPWTKGTKFKKVGFDMPRTQRSSPDLPDEAWERRPLAPPEKTA